MTVKEKIEYVKSHIDEVVQINPKGPVHLKLYTLTEYEDGPTLISRAEQRGIVKKFEEDGYIKNVVLDDDGVGVWFEGVTVQKQAY